MKKVVLCVVFVLALLCCFAQKVRTVAEIPFDGEFRYFNVDPEDDSGSIPGVSNLHAFDGRVYFINATTGNWYCMDSRGSIKEVWHIEDAYVAGKGAPFFTWNGDSFIYGYCLNDDNLTLFRKVDGDKVTEHSVQMDVPHKEKSRPWKDLFYMTGSNLFFEDDSHAEILLSMDLDKASSVCRSSAETKKLLDSGLGESLGHRVEKDADGNLIGNFFGDHAVNSSKNGLMYYLYRNEKMDMSKSKYVGRINLDDTVYRYLGYDGKGLNYFLQKKSYKDTQKSKFYICVYDTWTKTPYFYEDYDKGQWNPPLDENGIEIPSLGFTVSNKGEVYYSDCDLSGKKYLIKQVENRWYDDIGIKNRHIGSVNASRVPYYKKASSKKDPLGFCFKGDLVWEKDAKDGWSKVQRLDGSTVWIETKYIDF